MWLFCDLPTGYVRVVWSAYFSETERFTAYRGYGQFQAIKKKKKKRRKNASKVLQQASKIVLTFFRIFKMSQQVLCIRKRPYSEKKKKNIFAWS